MPAPQRGVLAWLATTVLFLCSTPAVEATPVAPSAPVSLVGDNWCPYNCAPDSRPPGYLIDLIRAALGSETEIHYHLEPWSRAVQLVEDGQRDLLLATTDNVSNKLILSAPVGVDRTCFFVRAGSHWNYRTPASLSKVSIGVVQDYSYDGDGPIDKMIAQYRASKDRRLELAYGQGATESNFRKLASGRMDVVIENENVAHFTIAKLELGATLRSAGCISHHLGVIYLGAAQSSPAARTLLARIDQGIADLRRAGRLNALLRPYGIPDWLPLLPGKAPAASPPAGAKR